MLAHVYLRVSTDEQALSGLGLEAQEKACVDAIASNGWTLGEMFRDEGRSGGLPLHKRTVLLDAIGALAKGDVLLVAKLDRVSRGDPYANALIEHEVTKRGGRIVSAAGEGTADNSPDSILLRRLMQMLAERELLVIGERTKNALAAKRDRGERYGKVPYGFKLGESIVIEKRDKRGRIVRKDSHRLQADPAEARALEEIRRFHAEGRSAGQIARALDASGPPTKSGRPWNRATIRSILIRLNLPTDSRPARAQAQTAL